MDVYYFIIISSTRDFKSQNSFAFAKHIFLAEKRTNQVHGSLKLEGREQMQRNPAVTSHVWSTIISSLILPSAVLWFCLLPWKTLTKSLQEQPTRILTNQLGSQGETFWISKCKRTAVAELDAEGWFVDAWPPAAECLLPLSPVAAPLHSAPISHLRPPLPRCTCVHTVSCFPLLLSDYALDQAQGNKSSPMTVLSIYLFIVLVLNFTFRGTNNHTYI